MREHNYFEDEEVAEQWITAIESPQDRSREREYYPLLYDWSTDFNTGTIVEIGSGQGICSSKINLSSGKYIGIEPSKILVDRAKKLYPEKNKTFLIGNSYEIPLDDNSVDAVFSVGVWFHIEDLDRTHAEVKRILKPSGKLLVLTGNPEVQSLWVSYFENPKVEGKKIEGKVSVPGGFMTNNVLYLHAKEEITKSLEKNNFVVDSIKEVGFGKGDRKQGLFIAVQAVKQS